MQVVCEAPGASGDPGPGLTEQGRDRHHTCGRKLRSALREADGAERPRGGEGASQASAVLGRRLSEEKRISTWREKNIPPSEKAPRQEGLKAAGLARM